MNRVIKFQLMTTSGEWIVYTLGDLVCGEAVTHEELQFLPQTWRQFTGLSDKNGVEIYEGDKFKTEVCLSPDGISSAHNNFHWIEVECVVVFEEGAYRGRWELNDYERYEYKFNRTGLADINKRKEVIGNIYENPELLEGEDESV